MTTHQRLQKTMRSPQRAARRAKKTRRLAKFEEAVRPRAHRGFWQSLVGIFPKWSDD